MHFEERRSDDSEERILPLINVVFLLLIFFMIAGSLSVSEPFEVEPPKSISQSESEPDRLMILLNAQGNLALDGAPLSQADLVSRIRDRVEAKQPTRIQLKADGDVAGNLMVQLLEQLQDAGVERVQLLTVPEAS